MNFGGKNFDILTELNLASPTPPDCWDLPFDYFLGPTDLLPYYDDSIGRRDIVDPNNLNTDDRD